MKVMITGNSIKRKKKVNNDILYIRKLSLTITFIILCFGSDALPKCAGRVGELKSL